MYVCMYVCMYSQFYKCGNFIFRTGDPPKCSPCGIFIFRNFIFRTGVVGFSPRAISYSYPAEFTFGQS